MAVVGLALLGVLVSAGLAQDGRDHWSGPTVDAPLTPPEPAAGGDGLVPDPAWVASVADATDVPRRALQAYATAALRLADDEPECQISWNTLAGIGSVESVHGAFGGSRIDADGVARPSIRGLPLNGDGVAAIRDSDDGALDGDAQWDRAVGPMQFIPGTWQQWGADGDGDGTKDPHDIDDAALAAGRYLCHAGGDLTSNEGWSAAVLTYNASVDYASRVSATATRYADAV